MPSTRLKCVLFHILLVTINATNHSISKRSLLFPRATVLQFTYGLSVPLIRPRRSINFSLCAQVNYELPYNITQLVQTRIVQAKSTTEVGFDLTRKTFYKYAIEFLNGLGLNGKECLLRLICELAESPMHLERKENLLERVVHFAFTPSVEMYSNNNRTFSYKLLEAEEVGRNRGECGEKYSACWVSIANLFTSKYII